MPTRSRVFPFRTSRLVASAATLAMTLSAAAAQPRFPDPPLVPIEGHPGDGIPHDAVPADPVPRDQPVSPPIIAPVPAEASPHHPAPGHDVPPVVDARSDEPAGSPLDDDRYADPTDMPHGRNHGLAPGFETLIPEPQPWVPGFPPGFENHTPTPMGSIRPSAPLTPLPPVESDPSLGPPPGTLGRTYYRPSRYIPHDEHPRVGMLDLTLPQEFTIDQGPGQKIRVIVHDVAGQLKPVDGYVGDDGHWHFESDPLIPGIPHIYRVKVERVRYENQEIRRYGRLVEQETEIGSELVGVRFLRLIPGRIATLEF